MENHKIKIGIDIGGTKICAGLVKDGNILTKETIPTPITENQEVIIESIHSIIKKLNRKNIAGIGIGVPGLVNTKTGVVYDIQNIPAMIGVSLKEIIEKQWNLPVYINNDANCFALGAINSGYGKKFRNLIGLTLGTGLGGGIVINGKLHQGVGAGAGEFGFLPYKNGILEHYCSGQFFQRQYNITGKEASRRALEGDADALQMFSQFGTHLGEAIKMVAHVFAPEAVMLGGSISWNFDLFKESMWTAIRKFPYQHVINDLVVMPALGPEIALVGAAFLVLNQN
ncbi:MAG: sugar kinase [bacterium]|nr:MAG: sugar kinase [bacterium]